MRVFIAVVHTSIENGKYLYGETGKLNGKNYLKKKQSLQSFF